MIYEKPRLIDLSEDDFTLGALCNPGSSAITRCINGPGASGGTCVNGGSDSSCDSGTSATGACKAGSAATVACGAGSGE